VTFTSSGAPGAAALRGPEGSGGARGRAVSFKEALFAGLAPDGGLYLPVERPDLGPLLSTFNDSTPFAALAAAVTAAILSPEVSSEDAGRIVSRAFGFSPVLRRLDGGMLLLELFHGPTCAFKDFGAQFLAASMEHFLASEGRRIQILVATSGDTGSAVAHAFHGRANIDVVILYPSGRVSELQEKQLTTLGGNVHALEVSGSFDDCQRLAKDAFRDPLLRKSLSLTSANSINIGRLIPQSMYYMYALTRREELARGAGDAGGAGTRGGGRAGAGASGEKADVCVPSGNFGNLTAGVYAWHWGLPVNAFIAATNANDVVPQYLASGEFRPRASAQTLSNAMDVGNPSNFERLRRVFDGDRDRMRSAIHGTSVTDEETRAAMREVHERFGLFIDPHTAVGYTAARRHQLRTGGRGSQAVVLSTAHPGKFLETVREAVGAEPALPERLARCLAMPKRSIRIGPELPELSAWLTESFG
jgi:threonine synthase